MKYLIETHGCQMNVHDSERMAGLLEQAGYEPAADDIDADLEGPRDARHAAVIGVELEAVDDAPLAVGLAETAPDLAARATVLEPTKEIPLTSGWAITREVAVQR